MGELSDQDFLAMNKECTRELKAAQKELEELTARWDSAADFKKQIETVRRCFLEAQQDAQTGAINKEFIDRYIIKIFATPEDSGTLRLQIKLFNEMVLEKTVHHHIRRSADQFPSPSTLSATLQS